MPPFFYVGGQTQSPYLVRGLKDDDKLLGHGAPGGSPSGSAVGLAAGFAALAVATETDGSIVQPANRAALYGLKVTVGSISTERTAPWSPVTDSIGGMARLPEDLAALMRVFLNDTAIGSELAICDPDPVLIEQQRCELEAAVSLLKDSGAEVKRDVPLTSMDELELDGEDAMELKWGHDFAKSWSSYLTGYKDIDIKSILDIIKFNMEHANQALPPRYPGRQLLELAVDDKLTKEKYHEAIRTVRHAARQGASRTDKVLAEHDPDVILGPIDGRIPTVAAPAGYPVGTMPLGYSVTNGRPFGAYICIISGAGQEVKIRRAMSA